MRDPRRMRRSRRAAAARGPEPRSPRSWRRARAESAPRSPDRRAGPETRPCRGRPRRRPLPLPRRSVGSPRRCFPNTARRRPSFSVPPPPPEPSAAGCGLADKAAAVAVGGSAGTIAARSAELLLLDALAQVGIERVVEEGRALNDLAVIGSDRRKSLADGPESRRLGSRPDLRGKVCSVDDQCQLPQRRIVGETLVYQLLERAATAFISVWIASTRGVKSKGILVKLDGLDLLGRDETDLRFRVEESPNQPSGRRPVDVHVLARYPPHSHGFLLAVARITCQLLGSPRSTAESLSRRPTLYSARLVSGLVVLAFLTAPVDAGLPPHGPALKEGTVKALPVSLPGGEGGIGFDDLCFGTAIGKLLIPAGRTGNLDLIDPGSRQIFPIGGFRSQGSFVQGHGEGRSSADYGRGL